MKKFNKKIGLGLMSGSSLDGLDLCLVSLDYHDQNWLFQILTSDCIVYDTAWTERLKNAHSLDARSLYALNISYAKETARLVSSFLADHKIDSKNVDFVTSHGHTVFHQPQLGYTLQIGDGATLAAALQIDVISDLRAKDISYGGQGAPIVPIADLLLFAEYEACLNIGGIANISFKQDPSIIAYDICFANQALNYLSQKVQKSYDDKGSIARSGSLISSLQQELLSLDFHQKKYPKSLANEWIREQVLPILESYHQQGAALPDLMHTSVDVIAELITREMNLHAHTGKMMIAGGGAYNDFLIEQIRAKTSWHVILPSHDIIQYKEALAMAFIGYLRIHEQPNVLASVTGASTDTSSGIWHSPVR